jgi:hypothetical protein
MTLRVILCIVAGHRWSEAADVHETFPVLRCRRCGREQELAPGTSGPEGWMERGGRGARADQFMDGGIQRKP